jgi:hypothetical protein
LNSTKGTRFTVANNRCKAETAYADAATDYVHGTAAKADGAAASACTANIKLNKPS